MKRILYILVMLTVAVWGVNAQDNESAVDYIEIYQQWISPLKGAPCPMYPSCSAYGKMAFKAHSFPQAVCMTADRLLRCGHEDSYPVAVISGVRRYVDFPDTLAGAASHDVVYAESQRGSCRELQFIAHLVNTGAYSSALLEVERLLFYDKKTYGSDPLLYYYKLKCYEGMGEYPAAMRAFNSFPSAVRQDYRTSFTAAHIQALGGDVEGAIRSFSSLAGQQGGEVPLYTELMILNTRAGAPDAALANLSYIRTCDTDLSRCASAYAILSGLEGRALKSSALACALSIFPGGGYAYLGQWKSALASLLVIGALGYSAYTSFDSRNYGVGALCSVIGVSFYFGNIFGAGRSARRVNSMAYSRAADELRHIYPYVE